MRNSCLDSLSARVTVSLTRSRTLSRTFHADGYLEVRGEGGAGTEAEGRGRFNPEARIPYEVPGGGCTYPTGIGIHMSTLGYTC